MDKPLLADSDIEKGPTKEDNAELKKEGMMSWQELLEFFMNPKHWMVTTMVVWSIVSGLGMAYLFFENEHFDAFHHTGEFALLAFIGLGFSAYNAFLAEQLKVEVDRYWKNYQRLRSHKVKLDMTCKTLRESVGEMRKEVEHFRTFKEQMTKLAGNTDGNFTAIMEKAEGLLGNMKSQLASSQSNILMQYAMKFEFLDGEEGFSQEEFDEFVKRLPEGTEEVKFESIAKGDPPTASAEDVQKIIDRAVATLGNEK